LVLFIQVKLIFSTKTGKPSKIQPEQYQKLAGPPKNEIPDDDPTRDKSKILLTK